MNHINTIIYMPLTILILGTRSIYTTTTTTTILLYNIQYSIYNDEDIEQQ